MPVSPAPGTADGVRRAVRVTAVLGFRLAAGALAGAVARDWQPVGTHLRTAFQRLGPAFVKLGQALSVRPDLVPGPVLDELARLQDRVPPAPAAEIRRVVERELGAPLSGRFRSFEAEPVAAGSVAQVHRAVLPDGRPVAVKVRRPGVAAALRLDAALAGPLLRAGVAVSPLRGRVDAAAVAAEIRAAVDRELDFRVEAEVAGELARNFRGFPGVRVPRVLWGWTGRRVLTTEFVEGEKLSAAAARSRPDYRELAERGARAFLKQVLEDGLFHADLHPANLLITPEGEIAYVDFGIWGRLSGGERHALLGALAGLVGRDPSLALRHLGRLGVRVPPDRTGGFVRDVAEIMDAAVAPRLDQVALAPIGRGLMTAVRRHGVRFPHKYAVLVKALATVEGAARLLHPSFSFDAAARRYLVERARREVSVSGALEAAWRGAALVAVGAMTRRRPTVFA